jgi:D-hydroxyproline dehydrogenase subunit beta
MGAEDTDIAVIGAGIIGLAHAYIGAKAGRRVTVFERNPAGMGASIRNFGMIWPIGQPPGRMYQLALRSRELWIQMLTEAGLPFFNTGSLHGTYREDEAEVAKEFAEKAPALGYDCAWLSAEKVAERSHALRADGLLGALWSPIEITVDPRLIVRRMPAFLTERYGVKFCFNTAVQCIEAPLIRSGDKSWRADSILLAGGDDYQTLFPEHLSQLGLTRCKLQMLRTAPQPEPWQLGPALAFGLTFRRYPTFAICDGFARLKARVASETPEFDRWGIHVLVSQCADGALTLGDSHEYGLEVGIFDRQAINELILDYARKHLSVPTLDITETWHGIYAKHSEHPYIRLKPTKQVQAIIVTSGIGMTLSFGLAEETFLNC